MENTITKRTGEVREMAFAMLNVWDKARGEIKLNGRAMYNLIAIRRQINALSDTTTEAIRLLAENNGGIQEGANMRIPDDKIETVNAAINEMYKEEQTIEYNPIVLHDEDFLPVELMDIFFEFIKFE